MRAVGYATHYHANYVVPYWASSLAKTSVEGAHLFYRWPGGWGRPAAFSDRWSGTRGQSLGASPGRAERAACHQAGPDGQRHGREARASRRQGHRRQGRPGPGAVHAASARGGREGQGRALCRARPRRPTISASRLTAARPERPNALLGVDKRRSGNRRAQPRHRRSRSGGLGRFTNDKKWRE